MAKAGKGLLEGKLQAGTSAVYDKLLDLLDLVARLPLIKERILVIILLLHFLSLMLGSVLVLMLPLLVWLTPRSEERFSRNAETDLVCRLLLEKKKNSLARRATDCTLC